MCFVCLIVPWPTLKLHEFWKWNLDRVRHWPTPQNLYIHSSTLTLTDSLLRLYTRVVITPSSRVNDDDNMDDEANVCSILTFSVSVVEESTSHPLGLWSRTHAHQFNRTRYSLLFIIAALCFCCCVFIISLCICCMSTHFDLIIWNWNKVSLFLYTLHTFTGKWKCVSLCRKEEKINVVQVSSSSFSSSSLLRSSPEWDCVHCEKKFDNW